MRKLLLVCMLALVAGAGEEDDLLRIAVEAKLKVGDLLREKGDLAGAMKAYGEAVALWDRARAKKQEEEPRDIVEQVPIPKPAPDKPVVGDGPWIKGKEPRLPVASRMALRRIAGIGIAEQAVSAGLKWLAAHQDASGRWDVDDFMKHDPADDKTRGPGGPLYDAGGTGLALLAFLGAGHTDRGSQQENLYARHVRQGLRFLMVSQDREGVFGPRASQHWMYNHAIATLAMCEAYWMTRNPRYREPARLGLQAILKARNPSLAWRYGMRPGENDTSITAWCVSALHAGRYAGFEIDQDAFRGALAWLDKVTEPFTGIAGYNFCGGSAARPEGMQNAFPPHKSQSMTAAAMVTRILCGQHPAKSELLGKGARLCLELPPSWDVKAGTIDMYYWYYGTLALFQVGGDAWEQWNAALIEAIVKNQRRGGGAAAGSWDPIGPWQSDGGRIYSTALMTMCLEAPYRYERVPDKETK